MTKFYFNSPLLQFWLHEKNLEEYHIKMYGEKYYCSLFNENTFTETKYKHYSMWSSIKKYLCEKYTDIITHSDIDYTEDNKTYLWIHLKKNQDENSESKNSESKKNINMIIDSLNNEWFVNNFVNVNMVPKLLTIINKSLERDNKFMAHCICEYQDKYGKDKTLFALDVFFNDIKKQIMYRNIHIDYDSDSSD